MRFLQPRLRVFGSTAPDEAEQAVRYSNLGIVYERQGKMVEALAMSEKALAILAPNHALAGNPRPLTATSTPSGLPQGERPKTSGYIQDSEQLTAAAHRSEQNRPRTQGSRRVRGASNSANSRAGPPIHELRDAGNIFVNGCAVPPIRELRPHGAGVRRSWNKAGLPIAVLS